MVRSDVREAMVKIMLSSTATVARRDCGEDSSGTVAIGVDFGRAVVGCDLPMDPSTCTFWCAVGIGALVKGCSIESVSGCRRCKDSDVWSYGPDTPVILPMGIADRSFTCVSRAEWSPSYHVGLGGELLPAGERLAGKLRRPHQRRGCKVSQRKPKAHTIERPPFNRLIIVP